MPIHSVITTKCIALMTFNGYMLRHLLHFIDLYPSSVNAYDICLDVLPDPDLDIPDKSLAIEHLIHHDTITIRN
ncbi:hypothetical protein VSDG_10140 [Cytospora chrysosperma]|uniref:Uncharacterized protein n=1 Tax=Cytospora chrysosperma TaxID=252740 RepID=A0A423V8A0_CYTCH|nr:hypothetical protein VSDG_10140 [Valsa sordida]